MSLNHKALVDGAFTHKASDIHILQDSPTYVRIDGIMRPVSGPPVTREDIDEFLKNIMPADLAADLKKRGGADFAWQPDERVRFRVATYYERERLRIVMRLIPIQVATLDELGLPEIIKEISSWYRGLTLMTGVTGSGKSTTLAAMINYMNSRESRCIITIEDPIEMIHTNIKSVISQREVGHDVESFRHGLVQALRQDPDVILIGEMRDPDTIRTGLRAAETGHYVFSTMHTSNALHTVERILSEFPENEHQLLRDQLANNLRATITQRLVRRAGGQGRIAAMEIMVVTTTIRQLLLDDQIPSIATVIRERREGNVLFDQFLADQVRENVIDMEEAYQYVEDEAAFRRYVKGRLATADMGGITG